MTEDILLETSRSDETHHCPGCGALVPTSPRYPQAFCNVCREAATDGDGRALSCGNEGLGGGFVFQRGDDPTLYACVGIVAFIGKGPVVLAEARFGGVVAEPFGNPGRLAAHMVDLRPRNPDLSGVRTQKPGQSK